jgi:catechol 2,3-dioxygenase-like lactoylglutathione lyase family enzyme
MEKFLEKLISDLEAGRINRRQFCETVALAATVYAAGAEAADAPARGMKVLSINHLTYDCPDYRKARDFYSSTFGMETLKDDGRTRANLGFGPPQGQGGSFLALRTAAVPAPAPGNAVIDHVCYTIPNWNETRVRAALNARALPQTGRDGSLHVYDPFDYDVQLANAVEENAFRREQP